MTASRNRDRAHQSADETLPYRVYLNLSSMPKIRISKGVTYRRFGGRSLAVSVTNYLCNDTSGPPRPLYTFGVVVTRLAGMTAL